MAIQPFNRRAHRAYLELDVFSGMPNPQWPLDERLVPEILAAARRRRQTLTREARALWEPVSGYGGVILNYVDESGRWQRVTFYRELVVEGDDGAVWFDSDHQLEQRLFEMMPRELSLLIENQTFAQLSQELNEDQEIEGVDSGSPPACTGAQAFPPPSKWTTSPGKEDNRCYNYANDVFTTDPAVPGAALHFDMTETELHDLLVSDGLVPVTPDRKTLPAACHVRADAHLIAAAQRRKNAFTKIENGAAVATYSDFHFLRFDKSGLWSHKDGVKKPRNTDNKLVPLVDLKAAKFKLKHHWVGYYWTFPGPHRRIRHP